MKVLRAAQVGTATGCSGRCGCLRLTHFNSTSKLGLAHSSNITILKCGEVLHVAFEVFTSVACSQPHELI
jgi:hypothetical protein